MEAENPATVLNGEYKFVKKIGEGTEANIYLYQN